MTEDTVKIEILQQRIQTLEDEVNEWHDIAHEFYRAAVRMMTDIERVVAKTLPETATLGLEPSATPEDSSSACSAAPPSPENTSGAAQA